MKKIAVTQRLIIDDKTSEVRDALDVRLAELLRTAGYLPVPLPGRCDFRQYFKMIGFDGILLSGGNDLSVVADNHLSRERDVFEKKLLRFAIRKGIPVFGICRGMQLIADNFRGKLESVKNHAGTKHDLIASESSRFNSLLKKSGWVNSFHNYAISCITDGLMISARSEDGVIEAIEHKKYRIWGQMWHPEREDPFRREDLKMLKEFFG